MTPQMMIEIALCHAKNGATFLRDKAGIPRFRIGPKTDLLGFLIPQSLYYSIPNIESMTTHELCDGRIWSRDELVVINKIDHIQAFNHENLWVKKLEQLLAEYTKVAKSA